MKKIICFTTSVFLVTLFACKKETNKSVTVVRDCTGTYLRFEGKDYHVCNPEKVSSYTEGTTVEATFKKIKECNGLAKDGAVCYMVHENEGWVDVEKVK